MRLINWKVFCTKTVSLVIWIALPYLGKLSLQELTRINRVMKNKLAHCNNQFAFQNCARLVTYLHVKTIPSFVYSGIVCKF